MIACYLSVTLVTALGVLGRSLSKILNAHLPAMVVFVLENIFKRNVAIHPQPRETRERYHNKKLACQKCLVVCVKSSSNSLSFYKGEDFSVSVI